MINLKNLIFVEKYRPRNIESVVGEHSENIKNYINKKAIPHFLLFSKSPGTGKTSTALAVINSLGCDRLILNSSDDRKIEVVRERIKVFSQLQSSKQGIKRCIFMDEVDGMLKPSQNALRNIMEVHSKNCFFILTCNSVEKVIEPIQSRCVRFDLSTPPKNKIIKYLSDICEEEVISTDGDSLDGLLVRFYPDIRCMIQFLQKVKTEDITLKTAIKIHFDKYEKCFKLILDKKFLIIKDMVFDGGIDSREFNAWLFRNIFKYIKELGAVKIKGIIQILADNELGFATGAFEDIIFIASLVKIIAIVRG